jgi:hypothetical protein
MLAIRAWSLDSRTLAFFAFPDMSNRKPLGIGVSSGRALVFSGTQGDSIGSDGDADKPPVRHPGDGSGDELARKTQRLLHPYSTQMGDADAAAVEGKLVIGQGKTVMHPLLAELRILCTPRPEVLEGRTQLDDRHLWRVLSRHHPAVSGSCPSDYRRAIAYARVSSHDQKDDLEGQKQVLELFCAWQGWTFEVIADLGSGMNYHKKGLKGCGLPSPVHEIGLA